MAAARSRGTALLPSPPPQTHMGRVLSRRGVGERQIHAPRPATLGCGRSPLDAIPTPTCLARYYLKAAGHRSWRDRTAGQGMRLGYLAGAETQATPALRPNAHTWMLPPLRRQRARTVGSRLAACQRKRCRRALRAAAFRCADGKGAVGGGYQRAANSVDAACECAPPVKVAALGANNRLRLDAQRRRRVRAQEEQVSAVQPVGGECERGGGRGACGGPLFPLCVPR
jgi:hypothetical protein